jgi:hypothetical protein
LLFISSFAIVVPISCLLVVAREFISLVFFNKFL